jgi:hypothetical protein
MMSTCCDEVEEQELVDYSGQSEFKNALIAQGKGTNFLSLTKLDVPFQSAHFELTYRWLSQDCRQESDEVWRCVRGAEVTYWKISEMINGRKLMRDIKAGKANIFDHFNLF